MIVNLLINDDVSCLWFVMSSLSSIKYVLPILEVSQFAKEASDFYSMMTALPTYELAASY